ncbi:MAG: hypothetical protein LBM00_11560, partial [Deltaproteobacteria bacterium]|nr:hypothetical protein [Deltaproteobacteria bacterium]
MTQESTPSASSSNTDITRVPLPGENAHLVIAALSSRLALEFDPANIDDVVKQDNDLVFTMPGGSTVTIRDFFEFIKETSIDFLLPDGTVLSSKSFLSPFEIDVDTAASTVSASGGLGDYESDSGSLLSGVSRLNTGEDIDVSTPGMPIGSEGPVSSAPITIPTLSLSMAANGNVSSVEGENLVFTLNLSEPGSLAATAQWAVTVPGAESAGHASLADFDQAKFAENGIAVTDNGDGTHTLSGTVTIPAGAATGSISIPTLDDAEVEFDEKLTIELSNVTGSVLDNGAASASYNAVILDDESDQPLVIGPVDPDNPDPDDPDNPNAYLGSEAASVLEGGDL